MMCVGCGSADTRVLETRKEGAGITRRRSCAACGARFATRELPEGAPRLRLVLGLSVVGPVYRGTRLLAGPGGSAAVTARAAECLQVLSEAWPRLVSQEELHRRVWGRTSGTSPHTVKRGIQDLGRAVRPLGIAVAHVVGSGYTLALK